MRYWQLLVDTGGGKFLFGVRAEDPGTARDKAVKVIGDRTVLLEIREILSPAERVSL